MTIEIKPSEQPLSEVQKLSLLRPIVAGLYVGHELPFHGIYHVQFVAEKSRIYTEDLVKTQGAVLDPDRMEAIGWVHDVNYLVDTFSGVEEGGSLRRSVLTQVGYAQAEIEEMEYIIREADLGKRTMERMPELAVQVLSDADCSFKVDPQALAYMAITGGFAKEQRIKRRELAEKIIREQGPYIEAGIFFYTPKAREMYQRYAEEDLERWKRVLRED